MPTFEENTQQNDKFPTFRVFKRNYTVWNSNVRFLEPCSHTLVPCSACLFNLSSDNGP